MNYKIQMILYLVLLFGKYANGQELQIHVQNESLTQVLLELEKQSGLAFYFKNDWTDSVSIKGDYNADNLDTLLSQILANKGIQFLILQNQVILTGDVKVTSSLNYQQSGQGSKYLFQKEYLGNEVITIGNRSLMKSGSKVQLAGFLKNSDTGLPIESAIIYVDDATINTLTNAQGFYSLSLTSGEHVLHAHFSGMKNVSKRIIIFSDGSLQMEMHDEPQVLQEITIVSSENANSKNVKMGTTMLNMQSLKNVPKILGENDLIQAALTLPGVTNVGEGSAGINVRGGKTDQNLILLNNATIYNPFHFFGFFSSFNADMTGNSELLKSSIPASYGGRLSSLLDVKMKKASKESFSAKVGINPITTSGSMEIPLIKNKTSLMLGGRTTYSKWVINRVSNEQLKRSNPSFSDYAFNLNSSYGSGNSINVSGYYSQDQFKLSTDSLNSYKNRNISMEWSHLISRNLSSSVIAGYTDYSFSIMYDTRPESAFDYGFKIQEKFGKIVLNYFGWIKHDIQGGFDTKLYDLQPGERKAIGESSITRVKLPNESGFERSVFLADEYELSPDLTLYGGLRYSYFSPTGPRTINYYQSNAPRNNDTYLYTKDFGAGDKINTYHGPEWRLSSRYSFNKNVSLKFGFNQMRQYIHSISNTISVSPTDTWKLSDPNFKPQLATQYSLGYYQNVWGGKADFSVETYYKKMKNLLDYKLGAELVLNEQLETQVIQGIGQAYGLELMLNKPVGKLNGWISYAYSRSLQQFQSPFTENTVNRGEYFPSNYDKPHNFNMVGNYKFTRRYSFSMNVVYTSGRPVTYPAGKYELQGVEITHFSDRNSYRIPDYFRVDIGVNVEGNHKIHKPGHGYWSVSIYNVLSRKNVYSVFFTNQNGKIKGYELSVLGTAIPSITYNLKF